MAQSRCIGLYGPFTNLPFWGCAIYFDYKVTRTNLIEEQHQWSWLRATSTYTHHSPFHHYTLVHKSCIIKTLKSLPNTQPHVCQIKSSGPNLIDGWPQRITNLPYFFRDGKNQGLMLCQEAFETGFHSFLASLPGSQQPQKKGMMNTEHLGFWQFLSSGVNDILGYLS